MQRKTAWLCRHSFVFCVCAKVHCIFPSVVLGLVSVGAVSEMFSHLLWSLGPDVVHIAVAYVTTQWLVQCRCWKTLLSSAQSPNPVKEELQAGRTRAGGHKHSWSVCWCHGWTVGGCCLNNFAVLDLKCFNVHLFSSFSRYDYHFICLTKVMLLNVHTSPTAGFQSMTRKPGGFRGRRVNAISFIYHCRWLWWEQSKTTCRRSTRRSWEPSRLTCMRVLCPWWPSWSEPEEEPKRERATIRMPDDPADHFTL